VFGVFGTPLKAKSAERQTLRSDFAAGAVTMEGMTTAIVVTTLVLLGLGIVVNELLRLKKWLKNSPAAEPPDQDVAKPPDGTPETKA
jgi:hypothetical protein